ncbi:MAG: DUF4198 domain-containing protein, partial [Pseudomonadota bacterium]
DTFFKFERYFIDTNADAVAILMNGSYTESENNVAVDRFQDVRIVGPEAKPVFPDSSQWKLTDVLNQLHFRSGKSGTYAIGASIRPRVLEMTAEDFDSYLRHDGVLDVLYARRAAGAPDGKIAEKYSKHVKALFQVDDHRTDNVTKPFGYPIEIVPQTNPYTLTSGDELSVQVLFEGKPVGDQLVYASYAGYVGEREDDSAVDAVRTRTDEKGVARIPLTANGDWYVHLIHMVPSLEPSVDYESNWATLTFAVE